MKFNKKGFTLIELLAVITLLAIVSSVTIVSVTSYLKSSKNNTEKVFVKELTNIIEDYMTLNTTKFAFNTTPLTDDKYTLASCETGATSSKCLLYQGTNTFTLQALVDEGLVSETDLINPKTSTNCKLASTITPYRTGNYNYCFITYLDCYTDDENNKLEITNCDFKRLKGDD
jgi:prepilin-type N-terminal cleavage/methylation domain-containing protein